MPIARDTHREGRPAPSLLLAQAALSGCGILLSQLSGDAMRFRLTSRWLLAATTLVALAVRAVVLHNSTWVDKCPRDLKPYFRIGMPQPESQVVGTVSVRGPTRWHGAQFQLVHVAGSRMTSGSQAFFHGHRFEPSAAAWICDSLCLVPRARAAVGIERTCVDPGPISLRLVTTMDSYNGGGASGPAIEVDFVPKFTRQVRTELRSNWTVVYAESAVPIMMHANMDPGDYARRNRSESVIIVGRVGWQADAPPIP